MGVADQARRSGREPITLAELELDRCSLTYGRLPCQAGIGLTGSTQCFNTRVSCQDPAHYAPEPHVYRFCQPRSNLPAGLDAIPSLTASALAATKLDPMGGLGTRASLTLQFQDHPHHDRGIDPYWRERRSAGRAGGVSAGPGLLLQAFPGSGLLASPRGSRSEVPLSGTFWGRFIARNPYYLYRRLRLLTGYLVDGAFDPANFWTRTYLVDSISGPDAGGSVQVKGKDPLKLVDDDKAQLPIPSQGFLQADLAEGVTYFTLDPPGIGETYLSAGWVRINTEVMEYERTGDSFVVERSQFGTTGAGHGAGDTVQQCLRIAGQTIPSILSTLLLPFVDEAFLDITGWVSEAGAYLPLTYSTMISTPTPVRDLVKELSAQGPFAIFYDERLALVRIKAIRAPDPGAVVLNDDQHFLEGSVAPTEKPEFRVSQAWVYLAQGDPTEALDKATNYRQIVAVADLEQEGATKYGVQAIRSIFSRWLTSRANGEALGLKLVQLFGEVPLQVAFSLDAKDGAYWVGDVVPLQTRLRQDMFGASKMLAGQIIEANEDVAAHRFRYLVQTYLFSALPPIDPNAIVISIAVDTNDVNLLDLYEATVGAAPGVDASVIFVVEGGITIGQEFADQAMDTGTWPVGANVRLEVNGRVQGKGGRGAGRNSSVMQSGEDGGTALVVRSVIAVDNGGQMWGGGGGGHAEVNTPGLGKEVNAGGGGAGTIPGPGGTAAEYDWVHDHWSEVGSGSPGTASAGGAAYAGGEEAPGSPGGGPGLDGEGAGEVGSDDLAPGLAGFYLIGSSFVTWINTGDRRGRVS